MKSMNESESRDSDEHSGLFHVIGNLIKVSVESANDWVGRQGNCFKCAGDFRRSVLGGGSSEGSMNSEEFGLYSRVTQNHSRPPSR